MFTLHNEGNNLRAVPGEFGQVRVGPHQTLDDVILSEAVAMALRRFELRGDKLRITSKDPVAMEILKRAETEPFKRGFSMTGHPSKDPPVEDQLFAADNAAPIAGVDRDDTLSPEAAKTANQLAARELIEQANNLPLNDLRAKARLLCRDWPGGQLSRPRVIEMLERV